VNARRLRAAGTIGYMFPRFLVRFLREEYREGTLSGTIRESLRRRTLAYSGEISFAELLERKAEKNGDRVFLLYGDRSESFREINEKANRIAHALRERGACPGEGVGIMMSNCPEFLYVFYASQKLGMYIVPVNTALVGDGLAYLIDHSEIRHLFFDFTVADQIQGVRDRFRRVDHFVCYRGEAPEGFMTPEGVRDLSELMDPASSHRNPAIPFDRDNLSMVMYTSGTTGLPKGVVSRYRNSGVKRLGMGSKLLYGKHDILYTCLPLFHANALWICTTQAMWADARVALGKRFSARRFWDEVRRSQATSFNALGAMIPILLKQPPGPRDREHRVRFVLSSACPPDAAEPFEKRFGVRLWETYGAVDGGGIVTFNVGNAPYGSIGKPLLGNKYRLVDEDMRDVPLGEAGELIFWVGRHRDSNVEYLKDEGSTGEKVRDGWLHTGDLLSRDRRGYLFFRGRKSDYMRRRGENVSAYEIEQQVMNHPDVVECAAYGVPSELGEDDIMISVVPSPGSRIRPEELIEFLEERLPRFAMPRFVNTVRELPKTETHRVQKNILKETGVTPDTWDRERSGTSQPG